MDHIFDISQLRELLNESSREIQENISSSTIDFGTKSLLDSIAQQNHYVLSGIIEYLENKYFFLLHRTLPQLLLSV